ncbi:hypothetical protein [Pseudomonas syringae]|uniref:hypothetical protein n=1 Tax=Pseudomonas syringae TaxID=317 RepID=UPI003F74CA32
MDERYHERNRIGVIIHLDEDRYQAISQIWEVSLPSMYDQSLEGLPACRYVAFVVGENLKSVARIAEWRLRGVDPVKRVASIEALSTSVSALYKPLEGITELKWLDKSQAALVVDALNSGETKCRPKPIPPCLDLEDASAAVARRYGVDVEQVYISIHRKEKGSEAVVTDATRSIG